MTPDRAAEIFVNLRFDNPESKTPIVDAILAACAEERRAALTEQALIKIPTDTMEQEFARHYDRGYKAGRLDGQEQWARAERAEAERDALRQDNERLLDARLLPAGYELYRTSEIVADRQDAERYRWLRDVDTDPFGIFAFTPVSTLEDCRRLSGAECDAAIDAAARKEQGK